MKILFATDNFYPNINGAANFTLELARGLVENGHTVTVIAPAQKFDYTVAKHEGIIIYGIPSVMIPPIIHPAKNRIPFVDSLSIEKIIKKVQPQIIHIQDHFFIGSQVVSIGKKAGIPIIGTNHFLPDNLIHYLHPPIFAKQPLTKLAWKQFTNIFNKVDIVTTPTSTAARIIRNSGLKTPVIPISCGVSLNRFNPKKRKNLKPTILYVGRVDKEKNIDVIIKAFVQVLNSVDAQLVIAGQGKEKENLEDLTKQLGIGKNVTFTGLVPDKNLPLVYQTADIFVIASTAELQSIVTMEAMASGLPVIAANAVALPELVHHGQNGFLFKAGDWKSLAEHIIKILKDPLMHKKMSRASLKIVHPHRLENTIKSYEKIYANLIAAKTLNGPPGKYSLFNRAQSR